MNEQSATPRTDARLIEYTTTSLPKYCKLLEAELAAAREELLDSQKETLMAKAYKNTLKTTNSHLKSKLIAVTEQREYWGNLWADLARASVKDTAKLEREVVTLTEQRDRLAEALKSVRNGYGGQVVDSDCKCDGCEFLRPIDEALQSLTNHEPNEL